jgi:hypothetical protein
MIDEIFAIISLEYKQENNYIYQIIRIKPNKPINLKYFQIEKYKTGRDTWDFIQELYIGDGQNILFEEKKVFKNITTIKYRIENKIPLELKSKEYKINGFKPIYDGCEYCQYYDKPKKGMPKCKLHKEFIKKRVKRSCQDFLENE